MSRSADTPARAADRLLSWLLHLSPALVVLVFAAWLLWPVPAGVMPLSADHTVHLTRIWMLAEQLASGARPARGSSARPWASSTRCSAIWWWWRCGP